MKDEQVRTALEMWFEDTDPQPPDPLQTAARVMSRVLHTRQRGRRLPFELFSRKTRSPIATDTTEYQPSPIPATNGHTHTIIGRTQSMFGPAKVIAAGAVVFALVGAILIAQPFDQQGRVPGAATDDPAPDLGVFAPVAGRIVYGDDQGIWGVDPATPADPATTVLLTSEPGVPLGWSSDGTRLLVMRGSSGREAQLYVLHADGSETKVTERPVTIRAAAISPDGSQVVFAGGTDEFAGDPGSCWTDRSSADSSLSMAPAGSSPNSLIMSRSYERTPPPGSSGRGDLPPTPPPWQESSGIGPSRQLLQG